MKIQPVVEGHGELESIGVLLRRLQVQSGIYELEFGWPIRRKRPQLVNKNPLRETIRLALERDGTQGVLILFDADDDCPKELAPQIQSWAQDEARAIPCEVVMANREHEAWLMEFAVSPVSDPESIRGAKERLGSYRPTADQASLTARFDMAAAYRSCRSFRRMVSAFGRLAARTGSPLTDWPPASWT